MPKRNATWLSWTVLATLSACATPSPPPAAIGAAASPAPSNLEAAYERSIRAAAVRDPGFAVDLRTIDSKQSNVTVGTFTPWGLPASPTQRLIWVSLPDQLRALCHGKLDPVLAIEQALGLPPIERPPQPQQQWQVITFTLPRAALFRPCPGGTDVAVPRCANTIAGASSAPGTTLDAKTTRFLLEQIWSSDRVGFHTQGGAADWGYPFTGMGWTYNWDPQASSPVGATEFVVRTGTRLSAVTAATPAQFCGAADSPKP